MGSWLIPLPGRATADPDIASKPVAGTGEKKSPPPAQAFEWIQHGDASARRRARAHITRGFRRQKAAEAKKASEKEEIAKENGKPEETRPGTGPQDGLDAELESVILEGSTIQPYEAAGYANQEVVLHPTLGSGRGDPFGSLPVDLGPGAHSLLDHFLSGVAPLSFQLDARANFRHIKLLSFEASLTSPPAFHVILSAAASDLAVLHGKDDSKEAILHRGMAMSSVSKELARRDGGLKMRDQSITAVALFAGNELLFGDPKTFNTHMDGLASMLETRGSLESIRESKPQLYSIISWFDYSGACNLLSRRRFLPPTAIPPVTPIVSSASSPSSTSPSLSPADLPSSLTSPFDSLSYDHHGVPPAILFSLPDRYDLRQYTRSIFYTLQTLTQLPRTDPSTSPPSYPQAAPPSSAAAITATVDSELYRSICLPDQEGNRSRRRHIVQAHQILVLLYSAFLSHFVPSSPPGLVQLFCSQFETVLLSQSPGCGVWGSAIAALCESVLTSGGATESLEAEIERVFDKSMVMNWEEWRDIKQLLLDFFLNNELCTGRLQELWKTRLGFVVIEEGLVT